MDDSEYSGPAAHQDLEGYHRDPGSGRNSERDSGKCKNSWRAIISSQISTFPLSTAKWSAVIRFKDFAVRFAKGIIGIRDLAEILSGIRENAKILDGLWKLTATRKEGFAELLHGKEDGIQGRDYKSSWKRSRNAGSQNPLPGPGPWEYYLDSQPFVETKQQSENPQTVHE